ncbi:MAG: hypothetical protein AAB035_04575 [Nitrospirota bacterium]
MIIAGKRNNAALLSEEDWSAIQETLFLASIPGMRESIIEGMKEPIAKSKRKLNWQKKDCTNFANVDTL